MPTDVEHVKLKNGSTEAKTLVLATMTTLRYLFSRDPVLAEELVCKARNPDHVLWANTAPSLRKLGMITLGGGIHESVRNVVLSAVSGKDADLTLGDPLA